MKNKLWESKDYILEAREDKMFALYSRGHDGSGMLMHESLLPSFALLLKGHTIVIDSNNMALNFHPIIKGYTASIFDGDRGKVTTMFIDYMKDISGLYDVIMKLSRDITVASWYWRLDMYETWEVYKAEAFAQ